MGDVRPGSGDTPCQGFRGQAHREHSPSAPPAKASPLSQLPGARNPNEQAEPVSHAARLRRLCSDVVPDRSGGASLAKFWAATTDV